MLALPEIDAHSPELLRNARLMSGLESRSSVLPDSEFVWKTRSTPLPSWSCSAAGSLDGMVV